MELDIVYLSKADITNLENALRHGEEIDISIGEVKLKAYIERMQIRRADIDMPRDIFDVSMTLVRTPT